MELNRLMWCQFIVDCQNVGSIKLFHFVQEFQKTAGIHSFRPNHFNSTQMILLSFCAQFIFTTAAFLVLKAETMFELGFALFVFFSMSNTAIIYLIFIWQSEKTLKFIENCEGFIQKSEYCDSLSLPYVFCLVEIHLKNMSEFSTFVTSWQVYTYTYFLSCSFDRGSLNGHI